MGFWSAGERCFRSPSATLGRHQTLAISPFFAMRSLLLHCTAQETDGGITERVIDAFAPFEGLALRHIEDDRSSCSIGVLAAFDGLCDNGMAPQGGRWRSEARRDVRETRGLLPRDADVPGRGEPGGEARVGDVRDRAGGDVQARDDARVLRRRSIVIVRLETARRRKERTNVCVGRGRDLAAAFAEL